MRNNDLEKLIRRLSDEELRDLGIGLGLLRARRGEPITFAAAAFGQDDLIRDDDGWLWSTMLVLTSIELGRVDLISGLPSAVATLVQYWWTEGQRYGRFPSKAAAKSPSSLAEWCGKLARTAPRDELVERLLDAADIYGVHCSAGGERTAIPLSEQSPDQLDDWALTTH